MHRNPTALSPNQVAAPTTERPQYSLASMLESVTVLCTICAASPLIGIGSTIALSVMALAVSARSGRLAIASLAAAHLLTVVGIEPSNAGRLFGRELCVGLLACAICGWYAYRRRASIE